MTNCQALHNRWYMTEFKQESVQILTWQNRKKEDVVRERDESEAAQLVEDTVLLQFQVESLRHVLDSEKIKSS